VETWKSENLETWKFAPGSSSPFAFQSVCAVHIKLIENGCDDYKKALF